MAGDEETVKVFDCDSLLCLCEWKAHENRYPQTQSVPLGGTSAPPQWGAGVSVLFWLQVWVRCLLSTEPQTPQALPTPTSGIGCPGLH